MLVRNLVLPERGKYIKKYIITDKEEMRNTKVR